MEREPIVNHPQAHDLKTWPKYYEQVVSGLKPFELRKNDRNYQPGDYLILREWEPAGLYIRGDSRS